MNENKWTGLSKDDFDAALAESLPDDPAEEISSKVTPWANAILLILLSLAFNLIAIDIFPFNLILPTASFSCGLLGWNSLRGANQAFRKGWILMLVRSAWYMLTVFMNMTIWDLSELLGADVQFILSIVSVLLLLAQLVCLRDGIAAVQQEAGAEEDTKAVSVLILEYVILALLAFFAQDAAGALGLIMIIVIIAGLISVGRLSHALDEAGYVITPAPISLSRKALLGIFLGTLALGSLLCFLFFSRYPMKWEKREASRSEEAAQISEDLLSLGFPEKALADLSEEDIIACKGALSVMTFDSYYSTLRLDGMHRIAAAVVLSEKPRIWKVFYHTSLPDQEHYWGTEAMEIRPYDALGVFAFADEPRGYVLTGSGDDEQIMQISSVKTIHYDQRHILNGMGASWFSGNSCFFSFSLPNGYHDARICVSLTVHDAYHGIDFSWGDKAEWELTEKHLGGTFYIHQNSPWQYPVKSARSYQMTGGLNKPFETCYLGGYFFPEELRSFPQPKED